MPRAGRLVVAAGAIAALSSIAFADYDGDLVVEADELAQRLGRGAASETAVLDARSEARFRQGHLPGARRIDLSTWQAMQREASAEAWGAEFARLGIRPGSSVVVYDDGLTPSAARAWWLLRYWGVEEVGVLNGGWPAWLDARGDIEQRPTPDAESSAPYPTSPQPDRLVTRDQLSRLLAEGQSPTLIDTRSTREYDAGRIGEAVLLEWSDFIDRDSGKLLAKEQLVRHFAAAGIDPSNPLIVYCRTGGRASVAVFALEALNGSEVGNYYGGWAEWSAGSAAQ